MLSKSTIYENFKILNLMYNNKRLSKKKRKNIISNIVKSVEL